MKSHVGCLGVMVTVCACMVGAAACASSTTSATPASSLPFLSATISVTTDSPPPFHGPFTTSIATDGQIASLRQALAEHHIGFTKH